MTKEIWLHAPANQVYVNKLSYLLLQTERDWYREELAKLQRQVDDAIAALQFPPHTVHMRCANGDVLEITHK
jgi:hypothetical protein